MMGNSRRKNHHRLHQSPVEARCYHDDSPRYFYLDSLHIQAQKHTNLATSFSDPITINTTLVGGQVTWPDSSNATRAYDRTRTWNRAPNPALDELVISGTASGTRRDGTSFTSTILTPKVYRRAAVPKVYLSLKE